MKFLDAFNQEHTIKREIMIPKEDIYLKTDFESSNDKGDISTCNKKVEHAKKSEF